jgi:hypothetical protein
MLGTSLLQLVLVVVDNGGTNVLVHVEEEGEEEAEQETHQNCLPRKTPKFGYSEEWNFGTHFEHVLCKSWSNYN